MTVLLEIENLTKSFKARSGQGVVRAVDGVSFALAKGETLGIAGESGSGKSTLARLILRLIEPSAGRVLFEGADLLALPPAEMQAKRRDLQIVFQDPYASLDPRMTAAAIVAEPLAIHRIGDAAARRAAVAELLGLVGLEPAAGTRYPHEFSGGQRQRIGIARALALKPKLLVLDEPVSALDASIQAQVLNLLMELKARLGLSYIVISHDLAVLEHISDRLAVMYLGRFLEQGPAETVFAAPRHPYTQALASAALDPLGDTRRERIVLTGDPPSPERVPRGCRFHPRCPQTMPRCTQEEPPWTHMGASSVSCWLYD